MGWGHKAEEGENGGGAAGTVWGVNLSCGSNIRVLGSRLSGLDEVKGQGPLALIFAERRW